MNVLVTGGAGFIGSHLVRRLLREGCSVAVLDNFSPQVHAGVDDLPADVAGEVELYRGDVADANLLARALAKRDAVVHLAAETGTGQSMYEVTRYQEVNLGGTAALMHCLVNDRSCRVSKVVVASSRAIYGEGSYRCAQHGLVHPGPRAPRDLRAGRYDPPCPHCGVACTPQATREDAPLQPLSFYGLTKRVQEEMVLMFARSCGFAGCALRYQNVFGPGQSLCNPYTGILAIFSSLARSGSPIQVFEDGQESRDFIFVEDAVEATWRCIENPAAAGSFNVGTGQSTTVLQVATAISRFFGSRGEILLTGAFRHGDIRHNFADLSKTCQAVGFRPRFNFQEGLGKFLDWAAAQAPVPAAHDTSLYELRERGLLHG